MNCGLAAYSLLLCRMNCLRKLEPSWNSRVIQSAAEVDFNLRHGSHQPSTIHGSVDFNHRGGKWVHRIFAWVGWTKFLIWPTTAQLLLIITIKTGFFPFFSLEENATIKIKKINYKKIEKYILSKNLKRTYILYDILPVVAFVISATWRYQLSKVIMW